MSVDEAFIAMHVPILGALAAAILGLVYQIHKDRILKPIVVYCFVGFLGLTISAYLAKVRIHNIVFLWWVMIFELALLSLYFYRVSDLIRRKWKHVATLFLFLTLAALIHIKVAAFPSKLYYLNLFVGKCYFFAMLTVLVLVHFFDLISSAGANRIDAKPDFWISAGILIYAGGSFIPEISNIYAFEVTQKEELEQSRWIRYVLANALRFTKYIVFMIAFRFQYRRYGH